MSHSASSQPFRLSTGGLFYSLGLHAPLLRPGQYRTSRVIVALIALTWLPLILLSALAGTLTGSATGLALLADLTPHVRCLVAIPVLVVAAVLIDPVIAGAIRGFRESEILADADRPKLDHAIEELSRRRDSYLPDVAILLIAAALTWTMIGGVTGVGIEEDTASWLKTGAANGADFTLAGWWYLLVSSPVLQILLYRWLWRFVIWAGFLYRFSRIELVLEPAHPDLAGGLGVLKFTQGAFTVVFMAFGIMLSASIAEEIMHTDLTLAQTLPFVIGFIAACIALTSLPLLFFAAKLVEAKRRGRRAYGALGHRLARAFDARWTDRDEASVGEDLLHAIDPSAMADYTALYQNVKDIRIVPVSLRAYAWQAVLLAIPFLPLVLIEVPFSDVITRLLSSLV